MSAAILTSRRCIAGCRHVRRCVCNRRTPSAAARLATASHRRACGIASLLPTGNHRSDKASIRFCAASGSIRNRHSRVCDRVRRQQYVGDITERPGVRLLGKTIKPGATTRDWIAFPQRRFVDDTRARSCRRRHPAMCANACSPSTSSSPEQCNVKTLARGKLGRAYQIVHPSLSGPVTPRIDNQRLRAKGGDSCATRRPTRPIRRRPPSCLKADCRSSSGQPRACSP